MSDDMSSNIGANLRTDYKKQQNFEDIKGIFEPVKEKRVNNQSELQRMFEKLIDKRPNNDHENTSNGQTATKNKKLDTDADTARSDKLSVSKNATKSQGGKITEKNERNKRAHTEELKNAVAKRAIERNNEDIINGQEKSTHPHTSGQNIAKDAPVKKPENVQERKRTPGLVTEPNENELERAFAKLKRHPYNEAEVSELDENDAGKEDDEYTFTRSRSLKVGCKNKNYTDNAANKTSPLKRTKSVNDVQQPIWKEDLVRRKKQHKEEVLRSGTAPVKCDSSDHQTKVPSGTNSVKSDSSDHQTKVPPGTNPVKYDSSDHKTKVLPGTDPVKCDSIDHQTKVASGTNSEICDSSDNPTAVRAGTNSVYMDSSDHQTASDIEKNINGVQKQKPANESSTDDHATSELGQSTGRKEELLVKDSVKTNRPTSKPAIPEKPNNLSQVIVRLQGDVDGEDTDSDSSTINDAPSSGYPNESGVDLPSESPAESVEVPGSEYTEHVIEAFMPYIKHQIKVTDIIDNIHLSEQEKDIVLSKHNFCASDAFELLIKMIKMSDSKGKWQAFRNALDMKDFECIRRLIDGKTEMSHADNRQLLKLVTPDLKTRIDAQSFLDVTFEKELLTEEDKCIAQAQLKEYGDHAAVDAILGKIDTHRLDWNKTLITIFEDERFRLGDIADIFRFIKNPEPTLPLKGTKLRSKVKRSKSNEEMDWRIKNFLRNVDSSNLINIGNTDDSDTSKPTSRDITELTVEIRKLREAIESHWH